MRSHILEATKPLPIGQIFVTHHHEDHSGNLVALQSQHHCPVYAPEACCHLMQDPPKLSLIQKITWGDRAPTET